MNFFFFFSPDIKFSVSWHLSPPLFLLAKWAVVPAEKLSLEVSCEQSFIFQVSRLIPVWFGSKNMEISERLESFLY